MGKIKVSEHILVPQHVKLNKEEKKKLLEKYHITTKELPKILADEPAIARLKVEPGDIIKIIRPSETGKEIVYYRGVIHE